MKGLNLETEGKVIKIDGNFVTVEVLRKGMCGDHCAHCGGCDARTMSVIAETDMNVSLGDWVQIESKNSTVFTGLFCLFLMPLIVPLFVYVLSVGTDFEWLLTAVSVVISVLFIFLFNKRFAKRCTPRITRKIK